MDEIDKSKTSLDSESDEDNEWKCWSIISEEAQCVDKIFAMRNAEGYTYDFEFGYRNSNESRIFSSLIESSLNLNNVGQRLVADFSEKDGCLVGLDIGQNEDGGLTEIKFHYNNYASEEFCYDDNNGAGEVILTIFLVCLVVCCIGVAHKIWCKRLGSN
jgi:hypothetical protein